jgi:hypothetical protein
MSVNAGAMSRNKPLHFAAKLPVPQINRALVPLAAGCSPALIPSPYATQASPSMRLSGEIETPSSWPGQLIRGKPSVGIFPHFFLSSASLNACFESHQLITCCN